MTKIYKYAITVTDSQAIIMPDQAQIMTVQIQNGIPCLWALVDTNEKIGVEREILIFGTGNPISAGIEMKYIGTFQTHEGSGVWHVFEKMINVTLRVYTEL